MSYVGVKMFWDFDGGWYLSFCLQVKDEHSRRLSEIAMLEKHIMQAKARATSAEERDANKRIANNGGSFPDLGLPTSM